MVVHGEPGAFEQGNMSNQHPNHRVAHHIRSQRRLIDKPWGVQKSFGGNHPETLDHLVPLAHMLQSQGRLPEAEELFRRTWEGRKAAFGENHPMTHRSLRELAEVQKRRGFASEAQDLLHRETCHGFSTRYSSTSRLHAATLRSTQVMSSSFRAAGRLTLLEKELASTVSTMSMSRSYSDGSLTSGSPTNRTRSRTCTNSSLESSSTEVRKGRRLFGEAAEALLREFGEALLAKYGDVNSAFKAIDVNRNGTVSGCEFATQAQQIFKGDATAVFKVLDANRNGNISVEEFQIFSKSTTDVFEGTLNMNSVRS